MLDWVLIPFAYLIGSVSSAIVVCKLLGLDDPRKHGSGNPGATNVLRIGGKVAAVITLAADVGKAYLPVAIAGQMAVPSNILALTAAGVFLGNLYPVFFAFKGGKGVATTLGMLLAVNWQLAVLVVITWAAVFKLGKISSLAAITTAILLPLYGWFMLPDTAARLLLLFICILSLWRHRGNIQRLVDGTED